MAIFYSSTSLYTNISPTSYPPMVIGDYYIDGGGKGLILVGQLGTFAGSLKANTVSALPVPAGIKNPPSIPKLYSIVNTASLSTNINTPIVFNPVSAYGGQTLSSGSTTYAPCKATVTPSLPAGLEVRLSKTYATITNFVSASSTAVVINVTTSSTFIVGSYYRVSGHSVNIYNGSFQCTAFSQGQVTLKYPHTVTGTGRTAFGTGGIITDDTIQSFPCPESQGNDQVGVTYLYNYTNFCIVGSATTPLANTVYTVTFSDNITTTSATFSMEIVGANAPVVITVAQPSSYTLKRKVSFTPFIPVSATGGASYLIYSITPPLPSTPGSSGLLFNTNTGQISGIPDTVSDPAITYTVTVRDGGGTQQSGTFNLTVLGIPGIVLTLNPDLFPASTSSLSLRIGTIVSSTIPVIATGGVPPFNYSIDTTSTPDLPAGLKIDPKTGSLTGTPTVTSFVATYTVLVIDSTTEQKSSLTFKLEVKPTELKTSVAIASATLIQKVPVSKVLPSKYIPVTASGGYAPVNFSIVLTSNNTSPLPDGLSFDSKTGEITGTPTSSLPAGDFYTVTVTDSYSVQQTSSQTIKIIIQSLPTLDTVLLNPIPSGTIQIDLAPFQPVTVSPTNAGYGAVYYTILPDISTTITGLSFSRQSGIISGKPTVTKNASFTVTVTDEAGQTSSKTFNFGVFSGPLTTVLQSSGTSFTKGIKLASSYIPVTATGGYGTITFAVSGSPTLTSLGLSFWSANGAVTGTPTSSLTTQTKYTVTATDQVPTSSSQSFSLIINDPPALTVTRSFTSKIIYVGDTYTGSSFVPVTASNNDISPIQYSLSPLPMAGGLVYSTVSGNITGTVTTANVNTTINFTVTATDLLSQTANTSFDITVSYPDFTTSLDISAKTLKQNVLADPFTPVSAKGGYGTKSFSIAPTVPAGNLSISGLGLSYSSSTGTISGTPTSAITSISYTVTASTSVGQTSSKAFLLTITSPPAPPAIVTTLKVSNQTLVVGQKNVSVIPVTATGGVGTLTFTLGSSLPSGLTFTTTGQILGIPTVTSSTTSYNVIVTDQNSPTPTVENSKSFSLTINSPDAIVLTQAYPSSTFIKGVSITPYTPVTATGGFGTLTFQAVGSDNTFINGLTYSSTDGKVSGIPTDFVATKLLTVTVTDQAGQTATSSFSITVTPNALKSTLTVTRPLVFTRNIKIDSFVPIIVEGGYAGYTYSISPSLPSTLDFDTNTGTISNVAVVTSSATSYTVVATDTQSYTTSKSFSLAVVDPASLSTTLDYSTVSAVRGKDTVNVSPVSATGGYGTISFSANISVQTIGLTFSTLGKLSGVPTQQFANSAILITATDSLPYTPQTSSKIFYLEVVNPRLTATLLLPTISIPQYKAASFLPVTADETGVFPYTYTVPSLPTGLSINADTGYITGTPPGGTVQGPTNYTVTITDSASQTDSKIFSLQISSPEALATTLATATISLTITEEITTAYQPVTVSGGTGSITFAISPSLPNSLVFDITNGKITGTPVELHVSSTFTITVTDTLTSEVSSKDFDLEVLPKSLTVRIVNTTFVLPKYQQVTPFTPVVGVGGYGTKSYAISPSLSSIGLLFDENTGTITGTPTASTTDVAVSYSVTVTDQTPTTPQTAVGTFTITISASVISPLKATLNSSALKLTQNDTVSAFPVTGTGGYTATGNYSYAISPTALPQALTFNPATGEIAGTADIVFASATYTITVTDDVPTSDSASFTISIAEYVKKSGTGYSGSKGYTGSLGYSGSRGYTGSQGDKAGLRYIFNSLTTPVNYPANGDLRYNSNIINSVTSIYISNFVGTGADVSSFIATWDDSTNSVKGQLIITDNLNNVALTTVFNVIGVTAQTGYYTVNVIHVSGEIATNGENLAVQFTRAGDGGSGYTGSVGAGYSGSIGDTGYSGSVGFSGSQGNTGPRGYAGSEGYWGSFGYTGSYGYWGSVGYTGSIGYTGSASTEIGYTGSWGYFGSTGYTGSQGDRGGSRFYYGEDPPTLDVAVGDWWMDSSTAITYMYTNDGSSTQWVEPAASGFLGRTGYTGSASTIVGYTGSIGPQGEPSASITTQGSFSTTGSLPSTGQTLGDSYVITSTGHLWIYTNSSDPGSINGFIDGGIFVGYTGSWGYFGSVGYTGSAVTGYTGSIGAGYTGSVGYAGSASTVIGYSGSLGYWGSVGYTGSVSTVRGYTGSIGLNTVLLVLSDDLTTLTTAVPALTMRSMYAMNLTSVRSNLRSPSGAGSVVVDMLVEGVSVFGTNKLTIDVGEKTSLTSSVPITIVNPNIDDDAEITFNITSAGAGASGLKVAIYY